MAATDPTLPPGLSLEDLRSAINTANVKRAKGNLDTQSRSYTIDANDQLATALHTFESETGLDVELLDVNALFDAIAADPLAYGFVNVDQPVLAIPPIQPGTPEVYNPAIVGQDPAVRHATLFIDPVFHPTALGHAILGETARDDLLA